MPRSTIPTARSFPVWSALLRDASALILLSALCAAASRAQSSPPAAPASPAATASAKTPAPLPAPDARKAREAYDAGRRAEQSLDWQTAYTDQTEAAELAPGNQEYELRRYLDRFALVQQYTDRAERERIDGQSPEARADLLRALELDPGYSVAQERLEDLDPRVASASPNAHATLADLPKLAPQPGTHSFDFRGTTRAAYGEIAQRFGLIAQFDSDLPDRSVRLRLDPVDFETAMKVLGAATHTFYRAMDAHTFFVADDTADKRRQYAPEVEETFILPDSITPDDMNETVRVIRDIAGITRADLDIGSRRLTIRDTPEHIALAKAILDDIEQPRGELMLEIEILEVDRTLERQLGISPPTSQAVYSLNESEIQSLEQASSNGTLLQTVESIFSGLGLLSATGGASAVIPAVVTFGGGNTTFFAPLPSVTANFSRTISEVRSAQRLLLRADDGQMVSFFSGARFPVSLATLSANQSVLPTTLGNGALSGTLPTTEYASGTSPVSVIAADFNGSGNSDLAVANQTANTVSILLGNGDGSFNTHVDYPAGTGPVAIVTADINGDGKPDLAVADSTGNTVSILLGNGDGTFQPATTIATGNGPVAIAAGIFNNVSGHTDLAVVNQTDGTVSIFPGNGDGTFGTRTDYVVGTTPTSIAVADFRSVGNLDLAVTNAGSNSVSILLGNGDGRFQPKTDYLVGAAPSGVVSADFNLDGHPDLAVSNQNDGTVSILLGRGDGTFQPQTAFNAGADPTSIVATDFNNDGRPDVAVTNGSSNEVSVLLGGGDGTLQAPLAFATSTEPVSIAAGDFANNDLTDVAVAAETANVVSVILNSTTALGQPSNAFVPYPSAQYVDLGLNVHATPHLNGADEVTLDLQFAITSLAGQAINGIPILSNRSMDQTIRLRENQTSIISGIVQSSEIGAIAGWPWISQAAALGALTSNQNQQNSETDLLILVTPREVRLSQRPERSIYAGAGEPNGTALGSAIAPETPSPANNAPPAQTPEPTPAPAPDANNPAPNSGPPNPTPRNPPSPEGSRPPNNR